MRAFAPATQCVGNGVQYPSLRSGLAITTTWRQRDISPQISFVPSCGQHGDFEHVNHVSELPLLCLAQQVCMKAMVENCR
jgi:hypothetical protein